MWPSALPRGCSGMSDTAVMLLLKKLYSLNCIPSFSSCLLA